MGHLNYRRIMNGIAQGLEHDRTLKELLRRALAEGYEITLGHNDSGNAGVVTCEDEIPAAAKRIAYFESFHRYAMIYMSRTTVKNDPVAYLEVECAKGEFVSWPMCKNGKGCKWISEIIG